jgi:nucleoside-diphosphate-sugar epimerase
MCSDRPTILLTGATGVLGRALVEELAPDTDLLCLYHRSRIADTRVGEVWGDLEQPALGLSPTEWRRLCQRVDAVIHCAANTSWRARRAEVVATNVTGTQRVLELATDAGAILYHVGTAFTARAPATTGAATGVAAYLDSKRTADRLVADGGVPAVIVRPSIVIGDSRDGRISTFQGLHKVMAAIYRGMLPVLPAEPGSLIDFVPQDVVARAVGALVRATARTGEFWLTAGGEALCVDELVGLTLGAARRAGLDPPVPRMIPTEAVHRLLLPLLDEVTTPAVRRQVRLFCELMLLFQAPDAMPSCFGRLGLVGEVDRPRLRAAFGNSIGYWAGHGNGSQ